MIILSNFVSGLLCGVVVGLVTTGRPWLAEAWPGWMSDDDGFAYFERKARRAYAVMYAQFTLTVIATGLLFVWLGTV